MQWIDFGQSVNQRLNREQLDAEQTKAKNISLNGHAIVRGVAGSGKSLVLRNRVETILAEQFDSVLVLTYNRFMQSWIESKLLQNGLTAECDTFHRWSYLKFGYRYTSDRNPSLRQQLIESAARSPHRYQAILVDEAQDFYDEWFQALLAVLDEQTNSLFFVYDNAQSVYGQAHRRKSGWSWASLGIHVVGRSQIFDVNYRNAPEILELAWKFIQPALQQAEMSVEKRENNPTIEKIIKPKKQHSRSSNLAPLLLQCRFEDMAEAIAEQISLALTTHPNSSIGILIHPAHPTAKSLRTALSKALFLRNIPHHAPEQSGHRLGNVVDRPFVIVDSWNALKGVEFDAVIIAGIDLAAARSNAGDRNFEEQAGLYTAMTRARDHLVLLYQDKTAIVEQVEWALSSPDQLVSHAEAID